MIQAQPERIAQAQGGTIRGRILDNDGQPAAKVRVAAAPTNEQGQISTSALVAITQTDELGRFTMENVPPGRFGIVAGAIDAPTFHPGTSEPAKAAILTVSPGSTIDSVDFRIVTPSVAQLQEGRIRDVLDALAARHALEMKILQGLLRPPPGDGWIFGKVVFDGNHQWPDVSFLVTMQYAGGGFSGTVRSTVGRDDGKFLFNVGVANSFLPQVEAVIGVAGREGSELPGDYYLKSISNGSIDVLNKPFKVDQSVPDVRIEMGIGQSVSGSVRLENGQPAANVALKLLPTTATEQARFTRTATTDDGGAFRLRGVAAGEYALLSTGKSGLPVVISDQPIRDLNLTLMPDQSLILSSQQ